MSIFSKRNKPLPDVYKYYDLPQPFRTQVILIWRELSLSLGRVDYNTDCIFEEVAGILRKEYGIFKLCDKVDSATDEISKFFFEGKDIERCLDVIELVFQHLAEDSKKHFKPKVVQRAIDELNHRFKEHGIGYEFNHEQIIRIDSKFAHSEIVTPALQILEEEYLKGASAEFLKAHEHYRTGDYKESINECLKAFESTMKVICAKRNWSFDANKDTASKLIDICKTQGLFPEYLSDHLNGIVQTLKSGVPTLRNRTSGHGQGEIPTSVSEETVSYVLHLTAANILFLASAEKNLDRN